ncbi:tetratricopeptide repeat-containing glycosyltransferase family protein [Burkholderia sola]|uniref:tetratricopeptide repeat-containing glycosyltransferase family protein n=1 Tax=Burkholderia sola TaxID=2843302 RepID=UPI0023DE0B07|nr:tetratricopeptide repeat-containing glycosyltransferase family protein [Burkholderia sola]MDF3084382.1 tetratricopeptide repeat-containing glycosyltransferase family protein [Burkholderia sola]
MQQHRKPSAIDDATVSLIRKYYAHGQYDNAIQTAQALLERHGDHGELLNIVGVCHLKLGNVGTAEACLHWARHAAPQLADVDNNLGVLYESLGRYGDAERSFRFAVSKTPSHIQALLNLGMLLRSGHRLKEAEQAIRCAVEQAPENYEALNALGLVLKDLGHYDEADAIYRHAIELQPGRGVSKLNLGNLLLYRNNWIEGMPLFEARHEIGFQGVYSIAPAVSFPQWKGEPIDGASLLIWPEQGHGDQIQLVRYVNRLKALGAKWITLVCSAATRPLFSTLREVDAVVARDTFDPSTCPHHDFWTYIWSIPFNLKELPTSIPAALPYLHAPRNSASKWDHLIPRSRLRVGLVWKGNPGNPNDRARSLPDLKTLIPLWQIKDVTFVSLQKEATGAQIRAEIGDRFIVNLGNKVADFADVAAIVSRLDLVIGVDTAVIHLSAALGKPTWILLSNVATDWRWTCAGTKSAWYPGIVTLFRQQAEETDWGNVVTRIAHALTDMRKL